MVTRDDIESYLDRIGAEGASYSEVEPGLWIVRPGGALDLDVVVHYSPPVVLLRVKVMSCPSDQSACAGLNRRLLGNKYLGPYITNVKERRGLPLRAKVYTLLLLWPSLLLSAYRLDSPALIALLVACGGIGTAVVLSLKTLKE